MGQQTLRVNLSAGRYVVAVSGGVDSVVLLDILQQRPELKLIVAHFDHGIREDSAEDATFVAGLAKKFQLPFESVREDLGVNSSEELARNRRYRFLRSVAKKYDATLVTAHHADDVIETITINCIRGTGWRGLAVLDSDVVRPLTDMTKQEILDYAAVHGIMWHEDSTNASDAYLRNRVRHQTRSLDGDVKRQLLALWTQQKYLKKEITKEVSTVVGSGPEFSRYLFSHMDNLSAQESLRSVTEARLTRPQMIRALLAIKTTKANKTYQAGTGVQLRFTSRNFMVELIK